MSMQDKFQCLIDKLSPKPYFNLEFYKGEDSYSDGDVEDTIIDIIARNEPENYISDIYDNYSWPTYYHLTPIRQNILNWYPFKENSSVLEIGCGLGAITGLLCDRCERVTAVELSKRRATAALLRCREKENLEIIVGNLNDIEFTEKFDYITLIGVLEYQGSYTEGRNPYQEFLVKVKSLLKPEGKLLIAIENQYGLKYWCGAPEDHTMIPFEGINGYRYTDRRVRTFSRKALERLVRDSGFANSYFYYPMPDYKLPTIIYSENNLPQSSSSDVVNFYYIPDNLSMFVDEKKLYQEIIDNGTFEFFANSFLVECSDGVDIGETEYACVSNIRNKGYEMITRITKDNQVIKVPCKKSEGQAHINEIMSNEAWLEEKDVKVCKGTLSDGELVYRRLFGRNLDDVIIEAYKNEDAAAIYDIFDRLYEEILKSSEQAASDDNLMLELGIGAAAKKDAYGPILKKAYIDMICRNVIVEDGEWVFIDQEWMLENTPAKYIMYRAFSMLYASYEFLETVVSEDDVIKRYGLEQCCEDFKKLEEVFCEIIIDSKLLIENRSLPGVDDERIKRNLMYLMNNKS